MQILIWIQNYKKKQVRYVGRFKVRSQCSKNQCSVLMKASHSKSKKSLFGFNMIVQHKLLIKSEVENAQTVHCIVNIKQFVTVQN